MRTFLALCCASLLLAESVAAADAHHQILSQEPIKKGGKVIGFRATVLVDPQGLTSEHTTLGGDVRLGLGGLKYDRSKAVAGNSDHHRDAVAGTAEGYILHQFKMREVTGPKATDRGSPSETLRSGGQAKEVEVEVLYKDNPGLVPGTNVDLVAGFWKGRYWHVWGAADSPTSSTRDFVIKLPGAAPRAFVNKQLRAFEARLPKARKDAAAAQKQFEKADRENAAAQQAVQVAAAPRDEAARVQAQADAAASQAFRQATQGPKAAYSQARQVADAAYEKAVAVPKAAMIQASSAARAKRAASTSPTASDDFFKDMDAVHTIYQAATAGAEAARTQTLAQATSTYEQATKGAQAIYDQATQAAQGVYDAAVAPHLAALQAAYTRRSAAVEALDEATTAKSNADLALKDITDKIVDYKAMLQPRQAR